MRLVCNLNMFSQSPLLVVDDFNDTKLIGHYDVPDLHKAIVEYCYENNISNVSLYGNHKFLEEVENDITKYNRLNYSNKMIINVEVN